MKNKPATPHADALRPVTVGDARNAYAFSVRRTLKTKVQDDLAKGQWKELENGAVTCTGSRYQITFKRNEHNNVVLDGKVKEL
jgi:hypothetical protein